MKYNVLLLGSGGREHALAWGMAKSPKLEQLFIAPGNPGTESLGKNVQLNASDFDEVWEFIQTHSIHLTVVGPEQPLVEGIADFLEENVTPCLVPNRKQRCWKEVKNLPRIS